MWISVAIGLLLIAAAFFASSFWWVFIAPLPVLAICQSVALTSDARNAERFFGFTDLAYYLIIGAVIGLGTQYLPELDRVFQQDAELTFAQADAELPTAKASAQVASEDRQQATLTLETIPTDIIGDCTARQLTAEIERSIEIDRQPDRLGLMLPDYPPGCEIPLSIVDSAARATGEAIATNKRVRELSEVVERGPNASVKSSDLFSPDTLEWLLFKLFPALVLCGVMLKIGKATLSIRKSI